MSSNSYTGVIKALRGDEDEIVKFFASKTIENITSQSITTGVKFANTDVLNLMLQIFTTTKNEGLKVCSSICLNNICRINTSLSVVLLEKLSFKQICYIFLDGLQRVQQVKIRFLCFYLYYLIVFCKYSKYSFIELPTKNSAVYR